MIAFLMCQGVGVFLSAEPPVLGAWMMAVVIIRSNVSSEKTQSASIFLDIGLLGLAQHWVYSWDSR